MAELFRFAAFLSYASKDAAFARRLHTALERFRIPTALGRFDLAGNPNRVYPVFRDREELPAGILNDQLEAALRASNALIVVCSPNAVKSPWVNAEIRYFRSLGRGERIFAIIADGEPNASLAGRPELECFPEALREGTGEPLAADARPGKDGFRNAWLKIVAGLLSVNAGVLQDRDRRLRRRNALLGATAVAALLVAAVVTVGLFDRAGAREAFAGRATLLTERGDRAAALPFALAGLGAQKGEAALERLGGRVPLVAVLNARTPNEEMRISPDGRSLATRSGNYEFALWDLATGKQRGPIHAAQSFWFTDSSRRVVLYNEDHTEIVDAVTGVSIATLQGIEVARDGDSIFVAGDVVAAPTGEGVTVWDAGTGRAVATLDVPGVVAPLHLSPSGKRLVACDDNQACSVWNVATGLKIADLKSVLGHVDLSRDDSRAAAGTGYGELTLWDLTTGAVLKTIATGGDIQDVRFSSDGSRLAIATQGRPAQLVDGRSGNLVATMGNTNDGSDTIQFAGNRLLVHGPDATGTLWDILSGKQLLSLSANAAAAMAISPDGSTLVVQDAQKRVTLWDAVRGRKIADRGPDDPIESVMFSAGNGLFLVRTQSAGATLWSRAGNKIEDFGWRGSELDMQISSDAARLVGFAGDGVVEVWNTRHALVEGDGESLRASICAADAGAVPSFRPEDRGANDAVGGFLRGRPLQVCEWRGLWSPEGWGQTLRYFGVRLGIAPDYRAP